MATDLQMSDSSLVLILELCVVDRSFYVFLMSAGCFLNGSSGSYLLFIRGLITYHGHCVRIQLHLLPRCQLREDFVAVFVAVSSRVLFLMH